MNREAGPVAFDSPPSSTDTSKVNLSPSSFGDFRTTTASSTVSPSALSTDIVAFGGFLAKLSLPSSHSLRKCLVSTCPAALYGRSAKTIEFDPTSVIVRMLPWIVAPRELMTASEGIMSPLVDCGWPIVFCAGAAIASWADAASGAAKSAPKPAQKPITVVLSIDCPSCLTSPGSVRRLSFGTENLLSLVVIVTRNPAQLDRPLVHRLADGANTAVRQLARQPFWLNRKVRDKDHDRHHRGIAANPELGPPARQGCDRDWRRPGHRARHGGRLRPRGRRRVGHRHCRIHQFDARSGALNPRGIGGDRAHGR